MKGETDDKNENYSLPEFYSTYNEINESKRYHVKPNSYVNVYPKHCYAHDKKKIVGLSRSYYTMSMYQRQKHVGIHL